MNEEKENLITEAQKTLALEGLQKWQKEILETYNLDSISDSFSIKESTYLSEEQHGYLSKILHWLEIIKEADTMKEIRLGSMRYGKKGDTIYTIKFLIEEIGIILSDGYYDDKSKDWMNGLYKWYKDNNKSLTNAYL